MRGVAVMTNPYRQPAPPIPVEPEPEEEVDYDAEMERSRREMLESSKLTHRIVLVCFLVNAVCAVFNTLRLTHVIR